MIYILLNIGPILAATLAGLAFGLVWHRLSGAPALPRLAPLLITAALAEFWLAAILAGALILAPHQASPWTMAIGSGFVIWIGFVLPTLAVTSLYRGVPARRIAADCGHWLGAMIVQAVVLQSLGLVPPPA